jgi:NTE family protein
MRAALDGLQILEALHFAGLASPFDEVRRIVVVVVNSLSSPPTDWDESEEPPGAVNILLKASGAPIDAFSFEATELLKDTAHRWRTLRTIRQSAAYRDVKDPAVRAALRVPPAEIYAIDVSFPRLNDKAERDYLNQQPTSFVLPPEAVDRLRAAARTIMKSSPEFQRLLDDMDTKIIAEPSAAEDPETTH